MWRVAVGLLYSLALVSQARADELSEKSACASDSIPDGGDDQCRLLQGDVRVHHKDAREDKKQHREKNKDDKGLPKIVKNLAASVGSTEKVQQDEEAIGTEVAHFLSEVGSAVEKLKADSKGEESIGKIEEKVRIAYNSIHQAALKVEESIKKTETDFLGHQFANSMPTEFKTEIKKALDHIITEAQNFADAFKSAASDLKPASHDMPRRVCASAKKGLEHIKKEAEKFAKTALGLEHEKGLKKAMDKLPGLMHDAVDKVKDKALDKVPREIEEEGAKVMDKAKEAMGKIQEIPKGMQEVANGVVAAFGKHCSDLGSARHLEVGLLSSWVVIMMSFSF